MKRFFLILFLTLLCAAMLFSQELPPDQQAVFDKFQTWFLAAAGFVYFVLVTFFKNVTWLPSWLNTKLISAILASVVGVVGVFIGGIPPLSISGVIGVVVVIYNYVKGYIEQKQETIIKKAQVAAEETALKKVKVNGST